MPVFGEMFVPDRVKRLHQPCVKRRANAFPMWPALMVFASAARAATDGATDINLRDSSDSMNELILKPFRADCFAVPRSRNQNFPECLRSVKERVRLAKATISKLRPPNKNVNHQGVSEQERTGGCNATSLFSSAGVNERAGNRKLWRQRTELTMARLRLSN